MPQLRYHQIIDVRTDRGHTVDGHYPPQPAQDKTFQRLSLSSDTSIPLFALYLRLSGEHDRIKYELLKGEINSILVFCGLFSATVAALVVPTIQSEESSTTPSDDTQTVASNLSHLQLVNLLWLFSLILSICCALHAVILQIMTRPPAWITSPCDIMTLPVQARVGARRARRIESHNRLVHTLHLVVFFSLVIFFSGLLAFFFFLDRGIFVVSLFLIITYPFWFLRPRRHNLLLASPHHIPFTRKKNQEQEWWFDGDVLKRTLDMSRSDDDLEQFFEALPGFCTSKIIDDPRRSLDVLGLPRLAEALIVFYNRTLLSNRVSESVKVRRLAVCVRVIEAADLSIAIPHILHLFSGDLSEVSRSVEIGHSLRPLRIGNAASLARGIIASIISDAERNDRWFALAMDELGTSRDVLRDYLAHGDSVLLANLIHITCHFLHGLLQPHPALTRVALSILPSVSKFDILNTLPELQHDFCALWNDVVRQVQSSGAKDNPFIEILLNIWGPYVALHGTTASDYDPLRPPASYPLCENDNHRNLTTHAQ